MAFLSTDCLCMPHPIQPTFQTTPTTSTRVTSTRGKSFLRHFFRHNMRAFSRTLCTVSLLQVQGRTGLKNELLLATCMHFTRTLRIIISLAHFFHGEQQMASREQAFQRNPKLQRFVLPDVRPTGKQLGVGSYGSVEELEINGLVCAGKRLHDALLQRDNPGAPNIERKYLEECQVMPTSKLLKIS